MGKKKKEYRMAAVFCCGFLYKKLWEKNLFTKIIYILIPFVLIMIFAAILFNRGAFVMEDGYAFTADYTNCYMLCYVFFFVYFVHGLFIPYFKKQIEPIVLKHRKKLQCAERIIWGVLV